LTATMAPVYPKVRRKELELRAQTEGNKQVVVVARVDHAYQSQYHPVAPVEDPRSFGTGSMVPSFITMQLNYSILGGLWAPKKASNCTSDSTPNGASVHVSEEFVMHRRVALGESITIHSSGKVSSSPHRLGSIDRITFEGLDEAGQVVWQVSRAGITVGPAPEGSALGGSAPVKTRSAVVDGRTGRQYVRTVQFTPDIVVSYCNDFDGLNPVHHDPAVAEGAGFRAPIWAGAQGIHICMEELCRHAGWMIPQRLRASIRLKRAVCWDESVELWFGQAANQIAGVGSYVLLRTADHKPALEMEVHSFDTTAGSHMKSRL